MRKLIILIAIATINSAFSQSGKVYLKNSKFKSGDSNTYIYEPPKEFAPEGNVTANILYSAADDLLSDYVPLTQKGKQYEFTTKLADSARAFFVVFYDMQKIADNNKDQGYVVYLKTKKNEIAQTLASEIGMRISAHYAFNLKSDVASPAIIKEYEKLFAQYPELKNDKSYMNYLYEKNGTNSEQGAKDMLDFAKICLQKNTEEYLIIAYNIYNRNNMMAEKEKLEKEILTKYPSGNLAKMKFIESYSAQENKTEDFILGFINTLKTKYNDDSKRTLIRFYHDLMLLYATEKNLEKAQKIESHFYSAAGLYNQIAWGLSRGDLTSPVEDIDFATKISKRSIDLIEAKRKESFYPEYNGEFNMYADTYALLLYKQGKYDDAFKYQSTVNALGGLDAGGKDRYLAMLDKVKSTDEVQAYIENEINNKGVTSSIFLSKLKEIYIEKKLPIAEYESIKQKTDLLAKENEKKALVEKFGGTDASDFTLKNLEGKETKLSDYKGKIVVLDFWATWCGPCKASFPKMQDLVTKYKDKDVAFLFVNTWENGKEDEILQKVSSYITEKKFDFNVVFDSKTEVVTKYNIQAIPTRIVIGKSGNILAFDNSNTDIAAIIEEQLK